MKGYKGRSIICAVLLFGAVLVSPALADMKTIEEAELARTNASVTGTPVKDQISCDKKGGGCLETEQVRVTSDKGSAVFSPSVSNTTSYVSWTLNAANQETFQMGISGLNSNRVGGIITSAVPH